MSVSTKNFKCKAGECNGALHLKSCFSPPLINHPLIIKNASYYTRFINLNNEGGIFYYPVRGNSVSFFMCKHDHKY